MSEVRPTVFVIDDDETVREAVEGIVKSVGLQVRSFASTQAFLQIGQQPGPSCLVLDVRLPGLSGLDFQLELAKADVPIPIVFITGYADVPMSVRAMKAGAVEFLTKPFTDQDLLDAIHHALDRDRIIQQQRSERAMLQQRFETLTERERQVMAMVVAGKLNREVAAAFGTTEITVKVQRAQVMRKMRADSILALGRMADKLND
jgi:FixJ family two-component response regulator